MINITDKHSCCGCTACAERCPKKCIMMYEDVEGFLYPQVDTELCINCGLCEKVCPIINQAEPQKPLKVFAAKNPNENIRLQSSSGGIFAMLAERTIKNGGVVFGVKFNKQWDVVHDYTETIDGIIDFQGSKYVQSHVGDNYKKVEQFLKVGREVLFTGTSCQIAGLHNFLRKEYGNLIMVDIVCHGVPSPLVWRDYLQSVILQGGVSREKTLSHSLNERPMITGISFRDKTTGWKKFSFVVRAKFTFKADQNSTLLSVDMQEQEFVLLHESLNKNVFMQGFLKNIYLRPSCYACSAKEGRCKSDITIADFWGINHYYPKYDDDKGCSLILINTEKGATIYNSFSKDEIEVEYQEALAGNPSIEHSVKEPRQKQLFWQQYKSEGIDCIAPICASIRPPLKLRCISLAKRIFKR